MDLVGAARYDCEMNHKIEQSIGWYYKHTLSNQMVEVSARWQQSLTLGFFLEYSKPQASS